MVEEAGEAWIIRRVSKPEEQIIHSDGSPFPEDRLFADSETAKDFLRMLCDSGQIQDAEAFELISVDLNAKPI